ncbi:MAG: YfhO family protein [Clostridia bacterium]|nr:YfhO family protein [Clostridia bacterium]
MKKDNSVVLQPLAKENVWKRFVRFCAGLKDSEYIYLCAAFFLPFAIMLGIYACMEIHPFGNNSVLMLDLQAQYIYYYEEIRSLLTEGGSFLYSWKRTLGGEFMGIIAYYGASPYNLIFALFPEHMTADAMMFINLMKIGSMGLTFGIYMHKTRNPGEMKTLALSSMYALCAYAVVQTLDPMWLDALVLLPLLILGLEALIKERKIILYTASLTMVFITNYYIGYMTGIFTFIYFLYYYFVNREELLEKYPLPEGKWYKKAFGANGVQTFGRFAFGTLIALMIAAFMLIAAVYSLTFGKSDFQNTNWVFALRFDFIEIFNKMLIGSYDTVKPNGLPMIYSGMLALLGLPMFYMAPSVKPAKKIGATLVLLVLTLSFMINPVDLVWHGFNLPNWLNYRYSFVFSFFVICMTADALCDVKKIKVGNVAAAGGIIIALVAVLQNLKYHIDPDQGTFASASQKNLTSILLAVVFIVAYVIIVYLCSNDKLENTGTFMLAAIVCVEMFAGGLININDVTYDVGMVRYGSVEGTTEDFSSYTAPIKRIEHVVDKITGSDTSFYRMESKIYRRKGGENESMAFGFNGIAHSTSTLNTNVIRLFNNIGYASQSHWTKYLGGTPLSDALFGIKYVITADDLLDSKYYEVAYKDLEQVTYGQPLSTIYAMENEYALPIAYGVSTKVLEKLEKMSTPYFPTGAEAQNDIVEAFLWDTDFNADMFTYVYPHYSLEDCTASFFTQSCKYIDENGEEQEILVPYRSFKADGENPTIRFVFNAQENGPLYAHFPMDNFGKACDIYVNDTFICRYDSARIVNLGTFNKSDKVVVELAIDDIIYFSEKSRFYFFQNNYETQLEALEYLKNASMNVEEHSNTMLKGTINIPEGQELILTTIPYDEGWNCYIDGEKVEITKALGSLLAIETTVGEHTIELRYMPKCYVVGLIVSAVGIICFVGIIVLEILRKRRTKAAVSVVCEETAPETAPAAEINEAAPAPEAEEKNEEK